MKCRRVLYLLLLFIAPLAFGQLSEKMTVTLVEVPVTVVDGSGNPVRGLTAENFQLSDDRGKHPITSFEAVDFTTADSGAVSPVARRSFLLLFDLSNTTPNKLSRAQRAARQFVKVQSHPADLFAVGTIETRRGFRMITAFTSDRDLLAAAIDNPSSFIASDPLGISNRAMVTPSAGLGKPMGLEGFW